MDIKDTLFRLSQAVGAGTLTEASDIAYEILSRFAECKRHNNLTVSGVIKGQNPNYTLLLDAHIDEVAMVVTDVDDNGFLTVAKCGGTDLRMLPSLPVTVHGKRRVEAVFCSTPPHLSKGDMKFNDISSLKIDTMLGASARDVISVGDYVTFSAVPCSLAGTRVTGKSLDDRAGVVCLLALAERLSINPPPFNVAFVFSDAEELGMRGAKTAAFELFPNEAIAIDVSFGDAPDISGDECGNLSGGAMIGYSPALCSGISRKLQDIAKEYDIPYQTEVMGGTTGTNGDVISITKSGVKTGLLSIPLRNMHTPAEVIDLEDIESTLSILEKYILSGGVANA